MLSKNYLKHLISLQQKKFRTMHQSFIVEGLKSVSEVIVSDFEVEEIFATSKYASSFSSQTGKEVTEISFKDCERISSMKTPPEIFALVKMKSFDVNDLFANLPDKILLLDDIQDAGNVGTIIRTADWFGINAIVASLQTAELYNPKVIQASMASFTRVKIFPTDLTAFIKNLPQEYQIYGTFLEGENIDKVSFNKKSVVVVGNESKGISNAVAETIRHKIYIPSHANHPVDSLNVSSATAILCYKWTQ